MSIYSISSSEQNTPSFDIEREDPSLNSEGKKSLEKEFRLTIDEFNTLFFNDIGLEYVTKYVRDRNLSFRIVTHPKKTNTCYEKAQLIGDWDPLNIIKALYFECPTNQHLYAVVVPETGCFIDKEYVASLLNLPKGIKLAKAKMLPSNMTYGTCSPFITEKDLVVNGGRVAQILFDSETLVVKKHENTLDDFSFGLDHRLSLHINYYQCYKMLKSLYKQTIFSDELMTLSFKEKFVRKKGKIKLNYDFNSINFRTAKFINSIHGSGDVFVENDYVEELDLPDVLTSS